MLAAAPLLEVQPQRLAVTAAISYDPCRTEGLTDEDMVEAILPAARIGIRRIEPHERQRDINWPTKDLKTKRGRLRFLTKEEELTLLAELDPNRGGRGLAPVKERQPSQLCQMQDNYDFVIALLDTGMRYDEMAKLPWSAVDIGTGIIRMYRTKVDLADNFRMTDRLTEVMERRFSNRRPRARYVFESPNGGPRGYTAHGIKKVIDRAGLNDAHIVKDKGGKVTIHTLRHTFASRLVQAGVRGGPAF
jgi:integrase